MSKSLNSHQLIGNLGSDPQYRELENGSVATFSVATNEQWKDKQSGDQKERVDWHNIVCYDSLAKIAKEHLSKGCKVYLAGKVKTRKWLDDSSVEHHITETIAHELIMLAKPATKNKEL